MLGRYDEKELVRRVSALAAPSATVIIKKLPDGSYDGTVKMVAKAHELPEDVLRAAEVVARWSGSASVLIVCNKDTVDRLEWPRRL